MFRRKHTSLFRRPANLSSWDAKGNTCFLAMAETSTAATFCLTRIWTPRCPTSAWPSWCRTTPDGRRRPSCSGPWATWHQSKPFFKSLLLYLSLNGMLWCPILTVQAGVGRLRTDPDDQAVRNHGLHGTRVSRSSNFLIFPSL
jgi:hypothetical protein